MPCTNETRIQEQNCLTMGHKMYAQNRIIYPSPLCQKKLCTVLMLKKGKSSATWVNYTCITSMIIDCNYVLQLMKDQNETC